jgi:hypothetical protein
MSTGRSTRADIRINRGGSLRPLQEIANRQADVAFMNRLPSEEERKKDHFTCGATRGNPMPSLGGTVMAARDGGLDSVRVSELRAWFRGETIREDDGGSNGPSSYLRTGPTRGSGPL